MLNTPQLRAHWTAHAIAGQGVMLRSERQTRVLHGKGYAHVVPLVDGQRSATDIVKSLAHVMTAPEVYLVLLRLEEAGHTEAASPGADLAQAAFWHLLDVPPAHAQSRVVSVGVVLVASPQTTDTQTVHRALSQAGLNVCACRDVGDVFNTTTPPPAHPASALVYVVLTSDYLDPDLFDFSVHARQSGIRWLPVRLGGSQSWLGPMYAPRSATCHACTVSRLMFNRLDLQFAQHNPAATDWVSRAAVASHPATLNLAAAWLARELVRNTATGHLDEPGHLLSLDHATGECTQHAVVPMPHCAVCGQPMHPARPVRIRLDASVSVSHTDGGHRTVAPAWTVHTHRHLVSPLTGVIHALYELSAPGSVAPVFVAGHNRALGMQNLAQLRHGMRWASAGKGRSRDQAMASALCEAIERYSGEALDNDPRDLTASYDDMVKQLGTANVIHPNAVMRFSDRQYLKRHEINSQNNHFHFVPEPLPNDVPIAWTPAWSMSHGCVRYLPTQLVRYQPPGRAAVYAKGCSNGSAAGNTLAEAILQGFCELVERDATAIWWYNRLRRPAIDLSAYDDDDHFCHLRAAYKAKNRDIWALDLTSDLGIPVVAAVSHRIGDSKACMLIGLGCHLDMRIAVDRAFAELNQMFWMSLPDPVTGLPGVEDKHALDWFSTATTQNQPYLLPAADLPPTHIDAVHKLGSDDLLANITLCRHIVESKGLEMLVLDQTRTDIGLPVAKVVVPGLRHFWSRLGPGRLYDVPVQMGWLRTARTEDELNPVPIFL